MYVSACVLIHGSLCTVKSRTTIIENKFQNDYIDTDSTIMLNTYSKKIERGDNPYKLESQKKLGLVKP